MYYDGQTKKKERKKLLFGSFLFYFNQFSFEHSVRIDQTKNDDDHCLCVCVCWSVWSLLAIDDDV